MKIQTTDLSDMNFIEFIKVKMNLKKCTIGISIMGENNDSFVMTLATPDNDWAKPIFIQGLIENAPQLITKGLSNIPILEVKTNNTEDVVEATKIQNTKVTKPTVKKEVKAPVIDFSEVERYVANKDWARAKYVLNFTLKAKHTKDPEALKLIATRLDEVMELSKPVDLFIEPKAEVLEVVEQPVVVTELVEDKSTEILNNEPEILEQ